jgi:hypothetical protein
MNDKVGDKLRERMIEAQANAQEKRGAALRAIDAIYTNPRAAFKIMQKYLRDNGEAAFLSKLEKDPTYFGGTRGHVGSGKFLSVEGFKERAIVKEVQPTLLPLIRATMEAEGKYLDQERAYFGNSRTEGRGGPDRGGPDFG